MPTIPLLASALFAVSACVGAEDPAEASREASAPGDEAPDLTGQVILVTGSTSGLGREVAVSLAGLGAHVIVHGRNEERGREVVEEIESAENGSARFYAADFASLDRIRELAEEIRRDYDRLDVLVNNAGIGRGVDQSVREVSADGHELRFQVNYLSGFLLTYELLPLLEASRPARIVNVASGAQATIDFDDVMLERAYDGSQAYAQSKLAQVLFTYDLAEELEGSGVTVNALHPATLMPTRMVLERGAEPMSTVDEGAEAVLNLILSPEVGTGKYFSGLREVSAHDQAYDEEARAALRRLSLELTGLHLH